MNEGMQLPCTSLKSPAMPSEASSVYMWEYFRSQTKPPWSLEQQLYHISFPLTEACVYRSNE